MHNESDSRSEMKAKLSEIVASRLVESRHVAGYKSGDAVEEATDGYIRRQTLYTYESGRTIPPLDVLLVLAEVYNVSLSYITGQSPYKVEKPGPYESDNIVHMPSPSAIPHRGIAENTPLYVDTTPGTINQIGVWMVEDHKGRALLVEAVPGEGGLKITSNGAVMAFNGFTVIGRVKSFLCETL